MTDRIPVPSFKGWIEAEHIVLDDREAFARQIKTLEGERVSLTLKKFRKGRSLKQNAWYWAGILPVLAEFLGYTVEELHNGLKSRLLASHEDSPIPAVKSTAALDTMQFSDYLERVRQLAAELGCVLPDPGEF